MTTEKEIPILTTKLAKMIVATSCCNCAAQLADSLADHEIETIEAIANSTATVIPTAELEALRRNAALGRAINRAAEELPDGYNIQIDVSKGSGCMAMNNGMGDLIEFPTNHETLADEISDAVDAALRDIGAIKPQA